MTAGGAADDDGGAGDSSKGGPARGPVPAGLDAAVLDDEMPTDGRAARAVRTRAAIVDALLGLLEEGDLAPTATRIAERAGISLRLIYHHFGDLESLFQQAATRQAERMARLSEPVDPALPLPERITAFVEMRTRVLEWVTPVRRASLLQEPFSEELRSARDALMVIGEQQVTETFGDALGDGAGREVDLAALSSVLGWGFWNDLRISGRSVEVAKAAVQRTVEGLFGL